MSKRGAERQLTKDDGSDSEGGDQPGSFRQASGDQLAKRTFVKAKRRGKAAAAAPAAPAAAAGGFNFGVAAPAAAPAKVNPLLAKFQLKPGQWSCPSCEVVNEKGAAKCRACEADAPAGAGGAAPAAAQAKVNPLLAKFQLKPGQWNCPSCDVVNEKGATKCRACEADAPGAAGGAAPAAAPAASAGGFSFGAAPAASTGAGVVPQFSFGSAPPAASSGGFTFGASVGGTTSFASLASSGGGVSFGGGGASLAAAAPLNQTEAPKPKLQGERGPSGEEDESVEHKCIAKVYRMTKVTAKGPGGEETQQDKWTESGKGELHVNHAEKDGKRSARVVMRAEKTHRVVLNSPVVAGLDAVLQNDKYVKFVSADWTQDGAPATPFLLRFAGKTDADACLNAIKKAAAFAGGN